MISSTDLLQPLPDATWDAFVATCPGARVEQTSAWATYKRGCGWRAQRIALWREGRIVAGAQLLWMRVPVLGRIAHLPYGPIGTDDDPALAKELHRELVRVVRDQHIRVLCAQAVSPYDPLAACLYSRAYQPLPQSLGLRATLQLDLRPPLDALMAQMNHRTRQHIRRALRDKVVVRQGSYHDLPVFHRLHSSSSGRQEFSAQSLSLYQLMWRALHPGGRLALFVAECEGEVVSAVLVTRYGDRVVAKRTGWNGKHGRSHPNEALFWRAICWAKEQGCTWFDWDGLEDEAVEPLLRGEELPVELMESAARFKLGFGGQAVRLGEPRVHIGLSPLRAVYRLMLWILRRSPYLRRALIHVITQRCRLVRGLSPRTQPDTKAVSALRAWLR